MARGSKLSYYNACKALINSVSNEYLKTKAVEETMSGEEGETQNKPIVN